jgi:hypothetical protein
LKFVVQTVMHLLENNSLKEYAITPWFKGSSCLPLLKGLIGI